MGTHPLKGWARWVVFPAISAAGGALGFAAGAQPLPWDWKMGGVLGLAPGLALAVAPRMIAGAPLALLLAGLGVVALARGPVSDVLRGLLQPEVPNLALAWSAFTAAALQGWRLREGVSWWFPITVLQMIAGLAVPCVMWWLNMPVEGSTFFPFVILAAGHAAAIEAASFMSPRLE